MIMENERYVAYVGTYTHGSSIGIHLYVYIANLGKYNEGYLVGAWFTFPIDEDRKSVV